MSKLEDKWFLILKDKVDNKAIHKKKISLKNEKVYEADFYLPTLDVYIELKGIMTLENMLKYFLISQQYSNFYVLQVTEKDWPITLKKQFEEIQENIKLDEKTQSNLLLFIFKKLNNFFIETGITPNQFYLQMVNSIKKKEK